MKIVITGAHGFLGWHTRARLHTLTDHDVVADVDGLDVVEPTSLIDEHVSAHPDVDAVDRIHRRNQMERFVDSSAGELAPRCPDLVLLRIAKSIQLLGQSDCTLHPFDMTHHGPLVDAPTPYEMAEGDRHPPGARQRSS